MLLIDTDAFCKLAICGLLEASARALGEPLADCRRLPALPHMLSRGQLHRRYGPTLCLDVKSQSAAIPPVPSPSGTWLDTLSAVTDIDPGEAQLFAVAIENDAKVLSGDKRAMKAVCSVPAAAHALQGRIVPVEQVLRQLCNDLGVDAVRTAVAPAMMFDSMISVCFSPDNSDPASALDSYLRDLCLLVDPTILWPPARKTRPTD